MNYQEIVKQLKGELARIPHFRRGCEVCHCKSHPRGMTFHHEWYKKGEKKYSDFSSGYAGALQYYKYLGPIIRREPKRFTYLCTPDHQFLTRLLCYGTIKQKRFFRIVRRIW